MGKLEREREKQRAKEQKTDRQRERNTGRKNTEIVKDKEEKKEQTVQT